MDMPGGSRNRGGIRMSDIAPALALYKEGREDSANSLSRWVTSTTIPLHASPVHNASNASSSSASTSLCSSSDCEESGDERGASARRSVRFADECGCDLVSDVRTTTNWWEEMVFGVDRCVQCGHANDSAGSSAPEDGAERGEDDARPPKCEQCGAPRIREPPSELFRFIEELSRGVEATLLMPTLVVGTKKRRVLLYTEDNGESISWMETGTGRPANPYKVSCNTLLEVKHKGLLGVGAADAATTAAGGGGGGGGRGGSGQPARGKGAGGAGQTAPFAAKNISVSDNYPTISANDPMPTSGVGESGKAASDGSAGRREQKPRRGESSGGGEERCQLALTRGSPGRDGREAASEDSSDEASGSGGVSDLRIKLRWRPKPTWSARKVTIVDVRCARPGAFARGMLQLRGHNTDLML